MGKAVGGGCSRRVALYCCSTLSLRRCRKPPSRDLVKPEPKFRLWERPCLCLEARNFDGCALKQIHVRIPLKAAVMIVVEADDHARKMPTLGLVVHVAVAGGGGAGGQNMAEADEGTNLAGCAGAPRRPRQSRHNRHALWPNSSGVISGCNCAVGGLPLDDKINNSFTSLVCSESHFSRP